MYWFKRKYRQIKRVFDFLPIIWKGYDWDYKYAIELFQHQLKRTADEIEKNGTHVNKANDVSRIRTAVELMEKVFDEEYQFEYATKIEEKYGPSKTEFREIADRENHFELVETFELEYTEEEQSLIAEERNELINLSRAKQIKAHKILWQYIEHNIQRWWD